MLCVHVFFFFCILNAQNDLEAGVDYFSRWIAPRAGSVEAFPSGAENTFAPSPFVSDYDLTCCFFTHFPDRLARVTWHFILKEKRCDLAFYLTLLHA